MVEINNNVVLVSGAKNAAIYDFNVNKLYSINSDAVDIIQRIVINGEAPISDSESTYISQLTDAQLISKDFTPRPFGIESPKEIKLNFVWLELTLGCNLKCLHCYEGNEHLCSTNELSTEQWKKIITDIFHSGCRRIQFTGGECALRSDLSELIVFASNIGIDDITIFTNASLLNETIIGLFAKYKIKVRFSIYGHDAPTHDAITQTPGSFEKTITNVKAMIAQGIDVSPAVVIMNRNEKHIEEIKALILSLGLKYSGYDVIREVFAGTQTLYAPSSQEIIVSKERHSPSFHISKSRFKVALSHNTCWYGKLAITPSGEVIPCIFERNIILGDITRQSISDILNSDILQYYWNLDFSKVEYCKDCEFRFACKDCRPLGMAKAHDIKAKNPRCKYDPYSGVWE